MSDYETDVAVEPEGYDAVEPDGDESYDEYVDEPERDEAITGAVQEAIDQVFGRPEAAAAAQDGVEAAMPELSEEDISAANEAVDESFDELEQFYGAGFDRQAAFETATQTFNDLVDDGVDAGEAFEEAMRIGAEEAATVARGEPLVKRLGRDRAASRARS
jgi:hypothetical protein